MKTMINVITRTHNRPDYFKVCRESIESQTYKDVNWIVGTDVPCSYYDMAIQVTPKNFFGTVPEGHYYAPWNKTLNELQTHCVEGWCSYVDDDDCYTTPKALEILSQYLYDENRMLIWKVQILPNWIVPLHTFGKEVTAGDFSGIGFMFHTKHLPIDWGFFSYGDFRAAKQLLAKGLKPLWIDAVLTRTQKQPNNGR